MRKIFPVCCASARRNSKQKDSKRQADNYTSNHLFPSLILPTAFCSLPAVIR